MFCPCKITVSEFLQLVIGELFQYQIDGSLAVCAARCRPSEEREVTFYAEGVEDSQSLYTVSGKGG